LILRQQLTAEHIVSMPINSTNPFANLIRGVEADVLRELCSEQHFQTATAIARNCGRSRSEVRVVLNYYTATEIVDVFQDGGYKFFKLNPKHPVYAQVLKLSKSFRLAELPRTAHAFDAVDERAL
jgi:DNA-binding transcriptional ArsR family regulator